MYMCTKTCIASVSVFFTDDFMYMYVLRLCKALAFRDDVTKSRKFSYTEKLAGDYCICTYVMLLVCVV